MKILTPLNRAIAVGFLASASVLAVASAAAARDYPQLQMRGPNGAFHLVSPRRSPAMKTTPTVSQQVQSPTDLSTIIVTRGPNGAGHLVTKPGLGGDVTNKAYPGFPRLRLRGPNGAAHIVN